MSRRIVIEETGKPDDAPSASLRESKFDWKAIDLQDCLIVAGVLSGESAAIAIWRPAALILACLFSFVFAFLIEKSKVKK